MQYVRPAFFVGCGSWSAYLGQWQYKRMDQKRDEIALKHKQLRRDPIMCPSGKLTKEEMDELEFRPAFLEGTLDYDTQRVIGTRPPPYQLPDDFIKTWGGMIYTKLTTPDGGTVMVNRGWSPHDLLHECDEEKEDDGLVRFKGVIRRPEKGNKWISAPMDNLDKEWLYACRDALNVTYGLGLEEGEFPVILDVLEPGNQIKWPRRTQEGDLVTVRIQPVQHGIYVLIWYSLAAVAYWYGWRVWKISKTPFVPPAQRLNTPRRQFALPALFAPMFGTMAAPSVFGPQRDQDTPSLFERAEEAEGVR